MPFDIAIRTAKPKTKPYKLTDGKGMFLFVHSSGGKYWRFKHRFAGKEKLLALGNDPGAVKKETKLLAVFKSRDTFEVVVRAWFEQKKNRWVTSYTEAMMLRSERHMFLKLGNPLITGTS